nr:MAG TPA: Repressor protein CI [Caudoviricetes sp.]
MSNLSKAYISVLEKNKRPQTGKPVTPSIPVIKNVAEAMNMSFDELFNMLEDNQIISIGTDDIVKKINDVSIQLNADRQTKVYNYAEQQLDEQNKVVNFSDYIQEEVKFYGSVSAGTGLYLDDEQVETISFEVNTIPNGTDFCLKVNGDSMEPTFNNGDYVFIKRETDFRNGSIGVVIVNGEAYLKKIYITDNSIKLVSLNKKYKDITVTQDDNLKYVGTVVF